MMARMVAEHHYLPFHGVIGKGLRHVAVHGETWLALIGWQPGAFKLAARDRWIGWPAEQQFQRLHLIANNSRFVILTPGRVHNLASRVLGLSLRRLSQDIQAVHGYPVFLAETFVDVSRFVGTCYRASNWRSLGLTRGFAREPGGSARWRHHGQPKEIFVFELTDAAAEALSRTEVPAHWNAEKCGSDPPYRLGRTITVIDGCCYSDPSFREFDDEPPIYKAKGTRRGVVRLTPTTMATTGSPHGFMDSLEAVFDTAHEQHRDLVRWYGGPFDPIGLDEERARLGMENMARRRRGPLASHRTGSRRPKR